MEKAQIALEKAIVGGHSKRYEVFLGAPPPGRMTDLLGIGQAGAGPGISCKALEKLFRSVGRMAGPRRWESRLYSPPPIRFKTEEVRLGVVP